MTLLMVDRATPPSDVELDDLQSESVDAIAYYCGGVNNGGRDWRPSDVVRVRSTGFKTLPIYVGENTCDGCKEPLTLTSARGSLDGHDAVACAVDFGASSGPLCLDVEYATYANHVAGALAYMASWADVVHASGYLPVLYAIKPTAIQYQPQMPTGLWIANWDGLGDLSHFPNAERFAGVGWQFANGSSIPGPVPGWDSSHVDGRWWSPGQAQGLAPTVRYFPETGHTLQHGFRAFWESHADAVMLFGYPISEEFTDADGVVVQWFERARFEWQTGFGQPWDVVLGRVGAEASSSDRAGFPDAFKRVAAPK